MSLKSSTFHSSEMLHVGSLIFLLSPLGNVLPRYYTTMPIFTSTVALVLFRPTLKYALQSYAVVLFCCFVYGAHHSHLFETVIFSAFLASLVFAPLSVHTSSLKTALRFLICDNDEKENGQIPKSTIYRARATLIACLLSGFFIALDWNEPWQAWPIPAITCSSIAFTCCSSLIITSKLVQKAKHA